MRHFEFTQKLSLLAQKGVDDSMNYSRQRMVRKKYRLSKSSVSVTDFDQNDIQLKLFEL